MEKDAANDVPVWKTLGGDEVTCKGPNNTLWVFHKDPVDGEGTKAEDPVPQQLLKGLLPVNDLAREHDSRGEAIIV